MMAPKVIQSGFAPALSCEILQSCIEVIEILSCLQEESLQRRRNTGAGDVVEMYIGKLLCN